MIEAKTSSLERKLKRAVPSGIKARLTQALTAPWVGRVIQRLGLRRLPGGGTYPYHLLPPDAAARIFFGLWEAREVGFARRFLAQPQVVELGASVGVVASTILARRPQTRYVAVEANPSTFALLERVVGGRARLVQAAVSYGGGEVRFRASGLLTSRIAPRPNARSVVTVPALTLSEILDQHLPAGPYCLITDIEGAEAEIFFVDAPALQRCQMIIAELETTAQHSAAQQVARLQELGFELVEFYGNAYVFQRPGG